MIDFSAYGAVLEQLTYTDRFSVFRTGTEKNAYGATRQGELEAVYTEIPCRLSNNSVDTAGNNNESNIPTIKNNLVFTSLAYDIMAGDVIEGYRAGKTWIRGICNKPSVYESHQQITVLEEGDN